MVSHRGNSRERSAIKRRQTREIQKHNSTSVIRGLFFTVATHFLHSKRIGTGDVLRLRPSVEGRGDERKNCKTRATVPHVKKRQEREEKPRQRVEKIESARNRSCRREWTFFFLLSRFFRSNALAAPRPPEKFRIKKYQTSERTRARADWTISNSKFNFTDSRAAFRRFNG